MRGEKEDSTFSLKAIKEKARDWWLSYGKLWTKRIFEYNLLAVSFSFVLSFLFVYLDLVQTDATSARYMLSALVQAQAAIVAIVVSLTLIAVQLTASAYSPRVVYVFKKNPDMWLLMGLYGMSIFYGLVVLKKIEGEDLSQILLIGYSLEIHIIAAYLLGFFSFMMLFRYMLNIMDLLKSESIISRLATEITKDNLLNSKEDPIQPIMDIIHGSIMKYDLETTRVGLKAVTDRMIEIIGSDNEKEVAKRFCTHLERFGKLSIVREDEEAALEVIKNLENFGKSTAEKGLENATLKTASVLGKIGRTAAEKELDDATWRAAKSLGVVGKAAAEKKLDGAAERAAYSLEIVGKAAAEKELAAATCQAAKSLLEVGKAAAEKELDGATRQTAKSLLEVGKAAAVKELAAATEQAARSLAELTLVNEKLVEAVIRRYKPLLEEQDSATYKNFINQYDKRLEQFRPGQTNSE